MFEYIIESSVFMKAIMTCCVLGVISWFILEISYAGMIRATSQIGKTKKLLLWTDYSAKREFVDCRVLSG